MEDGEGWRIPAVCFWRLFSHNPLSRSLSRLAKMGRRPLSLPSRTMSSNTLLTYSSRPMSNGELILALGNRKLTVSCRWPADVATFLANVTPQPDPSATFASFSTLSSFSDSTYLTTSGDSTPDTEWLRSETGKPNTTGYSAAPATIIVAPKSGGIVDAFYFAFYAYNAGPR